MNIKNTKWGVWGYGVVGKSVARFLHAHGAQVAVFDQKDSIDTESLNYTVYHPDQLLAFLEEQSLIVPSPGIDISKHYATYFSKIVTELDLFYTFFKKPIIAITGSVGKTTITRILSSFLEKAGNRILTGGNIGLGMCDLIAQQDHCDFAVLELSSFQLEYIKTFAPFLAIITPFHPNHLDRHKTLNVYRDAKLNILKYQAESDCAVVPQSLKKHCKKVQSHVTWYCKNQPDTMIESLPTLTFKENMNIICKAIRILGIDHSTAVHLMHTITLVQEHRLEHVATHNEIQFINDSKSTTPVSTLAALEYYRGHPIHLLLGGLSKGVCRQEFVQSLQPLVKKVYCFGEEALQLYSWCQLYNIPADHYKDLASCTAGVYKEAQKNSIVLLSPGGSSYDLFKNYEERGSYFKEIVNKLTAQYKIHN